MIPKIIERNGDYYDLSSAPPCAHPQAVYKYGGFYLDTV